MSAFFASMAQAVGSAFLAPIAFAFLGLIPIVILLYLLKLRRTPVVVPSTLLWRKSLEDLTANAPFQRLRKNLLLFLQILILLLLVFGLARPYLRSEGVRGENLIILVDRSASMQTREGQRTRLDIAKERALEMVDDMAAGDKMMVVAFADKADVLSELTTDRRRLRAVIRSIEAVDTPTRLRDAVLMASALQPSNPEQTVTVPDLRMVVLSDGKIGDLHEVGSRAFNVSFLQVGETSDNAGIVAFSVRDPLEGRGERQCLVRVHNDAEEPLETTLSLYLEDQSLAVEEVRVGARETTELLFAIPRLEAGLLRAELDVEDALDVDNRAWLTLRPPATVRVLLVTDVGSTGGFFLKRAFGLDPRVELSEATPATYAPSENFDVYVFDGFAPEVLPPGTLVFFNVLPPLEGLSADGELEAPPILATDSEHPMMRLLNPGSVTVARARKLVLPEGARTLISTRGGALVADVSRGGRQILVVAFDLADSNWPLRLSFPLFIQNLVAWAPKSALSTEATVATGRPLALMPAPDADTATVTRPDGSVASVALDPARPVYYGDTGDAGVYTVRRGAAEERFAVNLLELNESAVTPADSLSIGRSHVAAERGKVRQNRELWRMLVAAALLVLAVEWWIYSRRAWI